MNRIFISFSYNDSYALQITHALKDLLKDESFNFVVPSDMLYTFETEISQRIMEEINRCNIFICIFNSSNPSVMFELGYALAKNKAIVLIGDYNDIPYDLKNLSYIKKNDNINEILIEIENKLYSLRFLQQEIFCYSDYRNNISRAIEQQDFLDIITYRDFENIIYEYLIGQNLIVDHVASNRDRGFDFLLVDYDIPIEVKKYRKDTKVSLSTIRELLGAMVEMHTNKGIIITSGEYTISAINYVKNMKQNLLLLTLQDLLDLDGRFEAYIQEEIHG